MVVPQDREAFDAGLNAVLDEVRVSLDLGALNAFAHRWWISVCDSTKDPESRRHMHARAERALAGEEVPEGSHGVKSWPHTESSAPGSVETPCRMRARTDGRRVHPQILTVTRQLLTCTSLFPAQAFPSSGHRDQ
ncbi:DUF6247 family protein [Nonomuraea dietziae]|uniref:DUF6247 family protein n=1 Tax=Nonomuraea dietziae TaxID=65515 RepID=UPI0034435B6F